jgi:hypothetical protein
MLTAASERTCASRRYTGDGGDRPSSTKHALLQTVTPRGKLDVPNDDSALRLRPLELSDPRLGPTLSPEPVRIVPTDPNDGRGARQIEEDLLDTNAPLGEALLAKLESSESENLLHLEALQSQVALRLLTVNEDPKLMSPLLKIFREVNLLAASYKKRLSETLTTRASLRAQYEFLRHHRHESEVQSPRLGVLRVSDVAARFGAAITARRAVAVRVLMAEGGPPFIGEVKLCRKRSGRGEHLTLQCPACQSGCGVLVVDGGGRLRCRRCAKSRTEHQSQKGLTWWKDHGGREHDRVLRLVGGPGLKVEGTYRRAQRLIADLLEADWVRTADLRQRIEKALTAGPVSRDAQNETVKAVAVEAGL